MKQKDRAFNSSTSICYAQQIAYAQLHNSFIWISALINSQYTPSSSSKAHWRADSGISVVWNQQGLET